MAPRIQAKDLHRQGINIKYEYSNDVSGVFPDADPEVDEYAERIDDIMQNTIDNLFLVPNDEPFRKVFEHCLYKVHRRSHPMFSCTLQDTAARSSREYRHPKEANDDGIPRSEWQILPDFFSEVSRCLNKIDRTIGYKVHCTHRRGFRVPLGTACFQRTDCGQYIEVVKGGILKPFTRWPIKAAFYTTHLGPGSAEDHLAGEVLSLVTQVAFNYENDPTSVEGDQECFCITLHGQYVHFSTAVIPDKYIKYHNTGKPLKDLEPVKITLSPEYDLTKAEDRLHMIWGFVALYMHLNPVSKRQMKAKVVSKVSIPDVTNNVKTELAQKIKSLDVSK
ncbi:hypothetical protein TWF730_006360 [Orbilia blumenaviensis]|uniref:Uncharacterized protein n=1 Tax=Orbilia blumenaviensis TaxID=1796055 RepID=A0AAV9VE05_9PEZI